MVSHVNYHHGGTFSLPKLRPVRPARGFAVSLTGAEQAVDMVRFTPTVVETYILRHARPGVYLGAWVDQDTVYLDLSEIIADFSAALVRAMGRQQRSIFAFDEGKVVWVDQAMRMLATVKTAVNSFPQLEPIRDVVVNFGRDTRTQVSCADWPSRQCRDDGYAPPLATARVNRADMERRRRLIDTGAVVAEQLRQVRGRKVSRRP
jgi:hypothetical protein